MTPNRTPRGRHGVRIWELHVGSRIITQTVARNIITVVSITKHDRKREPWEITWDDGRTLTYGNSSSFEVL